MEYYKDHNGDPFVVGDEFYADHEAYIHFLADTYSTEADMPDNWQAVALKAEEDSIFNIKEADLVELLIDHCEDRFSEFGYENESEKLRTLIKNNINTKAIIEGSPKLWYGTNKQMLITREDVIEDLRETYWN